MDQNGSSSVPSSSGAQTSASIISGFGRRIFAFLIDAAILGLSGYLLGLLFFDCFSRMAGWGRLLGFFIAFSYFGLLNSTVGGGRTIGKRLAGIRVQSGNGNSISVSRSFFRFTILATPFFLNGAIIPTSIAVTPLGLMISLAVFGLGGTILYLAVFNRRSRQSLHDLIAKTYVVAADCPAGIGLPAVWKWHLLIAAVWLLVVAVFTTIVTTGVNRDGMLSKLIAAQKCIEGSGKVHVANILMGKDTINGKEVKYCKATAIWKNKPEDFNKAISEVAATMLYECPNIMNQDLLSITVMYGYDIGIARSWEKCSAQHSPGEWSKMLDALAPKGRGTRT
ncbi:MAG: RDD family protein [Pseudomonadota bacterium]